VTILLVLLPLGLPPLSGAVFPVTGAVACGWLDQWVTATDAGDEAAAQRAVDAMATSHHWAILKEMGKTGEYNRVVWEYGDAIATGRHMGAGGLEIIANDTQAFRSVYSKGLGCAEYRVR
jgi:hypothetical protein